MPFPILPSNSASGYFLTNSLRFRSSASAYLNRTPASAGNRQTWTWSGWVKRGTLGSQDDLFAAYIGSGTTDNQYFALYFDLDALKVSGYSTNYLVSTAVYRDPSAWYHIMCVVDTTSATANNRVRLYVNGSEVTAFSTRNNPSLNADLGINQAAQHQIGQNGGFGSYFDGYMTDINFIDGQALTPSSFGSFNALTGVWQPAKYTGTYGTNGFYLKFTDTTSTSTLGNDSSGNGNNWTTNNISLTAGSTYDSMTDVPTLTSATTANYPTFNAVNSNATLSRANLESLSPTTSWVDAISTMAFPVGTGKWYVEATNSSNPIPGYSECLFGVTNTTITAGNSDNYRCAYSSAGLVARGGYGQGDTTGLATYTTNDVIGMAVDCAAGTVAFYKNNTLINTTTAADFIVKGLIAFTRQNNAGFNINFGQRPFAYTPPTGFVALNTFNLPDSTIVKGNTVMDATTYTGNGSTQAIVNSGAIKPDLVWLKTRSTSQNHSLIDSVRGNTKILYSDLTNAENTFSGVLDSFNSNGFTLGSSASVNQNGTTFIGWQWQAGQGSTSSNTSGSITSTVSVNASAGFSVVTYTGSGAAGTVGHGLGVAPAMIITKKRTNAGGGSAATNWVAWHKSLTGAYSSTTGYIYFNDTSAGATTTNFYDGTAMTSSTFRWQTGNDNINYSNDTFVAYCWSQIAGYSAFGSYTGNGSTDGPFIYTGFRPRFVMIKNSDVAGNNWWLLDTARSTYNVQDAKLNADNNLAENNTTAVSIDFLSNGFKPRTNNGGMNGSGNTMIYMAFAENPFKNALAR
jgi:hypothetical protein